ncbi:MAG: A/G-specific adenine glycosylase [Parvularculaceae bacterium]
MTMSARKPPPKASRKAAPAVIAWYEKNARSLPWRIGPRDRATGEAPDLYRVWPYRVWLSEIMLQQTTVATVRPRFPEFLKRWPNVRALAVAPVEDVLAAWAGLGYYSRARNLHKCAREIVERRGGEFPHTEKELRTLPGIGPYTAAAIAAIAFDERAVVVDGNVERIVARLFAVETPLPAAKPILAQKAASIWPKRRSGDFAQGLMDLGATVCTPRKPNCESCPLCAFCAARREGAAAEYPRRTRRAAKPARRGAAFALFNANGEVLLERRPARGLLGGMLGLPGTAWTERSPADVARYAPVAAPWRLAGAIRHAFTHFNLELDVHIAAAPRRRTPKSGETWIAPVEARLPTVMKKALDRALAARSR